MTELYNIIYLEIHDFTDDGKLKPYINKKLPTIVMVQGNFCGYCTMSKPAFQELANSNNNKFVCCTIKIDGEKSEQELAKLIPKWDKNYIGVPCYLGFNKKGEYVKSHDGGRDKKSLEQFVKTL